jgi:pyridoxine 5'-phosphate synthase PdxJ
MKTTYPKNINHQISYKELKDIIKSLKQSNLNKSLFIKLSKYQSNFKGADNNEIITYLK